MTERDAQGNIINDVNQQRDARGNLINTTRDALDQQNQRDAQGTQTNQRRDVHGNVISANVPTRGNVINPTDQRYDRQGRLQVKDANGKWVNPDGLGKCPTCGRDYSNTGGARGDDGKPLGRDAQGRLTGTDMHGNKYDDKGVHPVNVDDKGNQLSRNPQGEWVSPAEGSHPDNLNSEKDRPYGNDAQGNQTTNRTGNEVKP